MPTYTYVCDKCHKKFELFCSIRDYVDNPKSICCKKSNATRSYPDDMKTISSSVRKSDTELKTIGDLANRNRDKLSEDEKTHLFEKHNKYKDTELEQSLPKGMSRIKKPKKKIKWT